GAQTYALATDQIHAVVHNRTSALGQVVFHYGRQHRRFFADIDGVNGEGAGGVHGVKVSPNAAQYFLHPFETCQRGVELLADSAICAHRAGGESRHAAEGCGQRDGTPRRERFHEHAPTLPHHVCSANDEVHGYEDIAT